MSINVIFDFLLSWSIIIIWEYLKKDRDLWEMDINNDNQMVEENKG